MTSIVTLADAKAFLNISTTDTDDELGDLLEAVSDTCERFTKKVWRSTTYTETYSIDGDVDDLQLRHVPVASVTSVTENGTTLSASDYDAALSTTLLPVSVNHQTNAVAWTGGASVDKWPIADQHQTNALTYS